MSVRDASLQAFFYVDDEGSVSDVMCHPLWWRAPGLQQLLYNPWSHASRQLQLKANKGMDQSINVKAIITQETIRVYDAVFACPRCSSTVTVSLPFQHLAPPTGMIQCDRTDN
jgi:hypothetical protein